MSEAKGKKDKKSWIGRLLLVVLFLLAVWMYYQMDINYRSLSSTNQAIQSMAGQQAALLRQYSDEVIAAKKKVVEAEQLVAMMKKEKDTLILEKNALQEQAATVLEEKAKLMDRMAELESSIADMKSKNSELLAQIDQLEKDTLLHPERIKTLEDSKETMAKFRQRMRNLDRRISEIKREMFASKVAAQQELDQKRLLAGNNGYLIRNGMAMPQEIILTNENENIKVDVQFVK